MGKTYLSRFFFFLVIGWWSLLDVEATAYSLRQFSSKNGLSNSAILSICQDCDGLIWIGSCDGLNVFDGTELRLYKPVDVRNNLSGNLIDNIMEAEDHVLWIQTNYGLDRFDTHLQTVQRFNVWIVRMFYGFFLLVVMSVVMLLKRRKIVSRNLFFSRCLSRRESCFGHQEKEIWFILLTVLMIFMSMICVAGINIS